MRPDEKEFLGNVLKMSAVAWLVHTFVEVPLHEYGHYWAASLLDAPLYLDGERTIWASGQAAPPGTRELIYVSGGLCAGAVLLVLFFLVKKPYRYGFLPLVAESLAYAPLDATMVGFNLGLVALLAVWIVLFAVFLARFLGRTDRVPALTSRRKALGSLRLPRILQSLGRGLRAGPSGREGIRTPVLGSEGP